MRTAAGKPAIATLRLEAVNQGTKILLRVSDDGAGINLDKVRDKAVQQGLIKPDQELTSRRIALVDFSAGIQYGQPVDRRLGTWRWNGRRR